MRVEVSQTQPTETDADLLVVGLYEGEQLPAELAAAPGAGDAKGGFQKLTLLRPEQPGRVLVVGLGKRDDADAERIRLAAAVAAKEAAKLEAASLAWLLPESDEDEATAEALVTGTILAGYRFDRYLSRDPDDPPPPQIESLTLLAPQARRRRRRGGPHLRRGAEPRPRPAEPALQRRHPVLPGPAGAGDRLRTTRVSAPKSSDATRSPPRRWAGWSRSARGRRRIRS